MTCPHCDRPVRPADLRCKTCRTKLVWWYVVAFLIAAAAVLLIIMTIENYGVEKLPG